MADVLLAHSFFLRFDPKQWRTMQPYPPLGTLYAAAYLRQQGFRVALFDAMLAESPGEFSAAVDRHRPGAVVFYEDSFNWFSKMCLTRMREACFAMIGMAKARDLPVVVAGSDVTDHPELYFAHGADLAIIGEGEMTLAEVLPGLLNRRSPAPDSIAGLALPENGSVLRTPPRPARTDLDSLPFPAWDLIDAAAYRRAWRRKHGYFSLNLVTTRGCPFRCNWCAKPIYGNRYNSRSPENVVQELAWLQAHLQPDHIWFADDIFGLKPGWMETFGEAVHAAGVVTPFKMQSRVDLLHEQAVAALQQAGCKTAWIGAESGSQKILDAMDKGTTVEQIYAATERLKRHGIEVAFFLQFGYPGETDEDIEMTLKMVRECKPDDIGISVSYPLPGTKFYQRVQAQMGAKTNWEHSDDLELMFPGHYQPAFYRQLHRVVHREFRLRKALHLLAHLRRRRTGQAVQDVRFAIAALARAPQLWFERRKLQRLKRRNPHAAPAAAPQPEPAH